MNVKTLIERLQQLPPDAEVCVGANMSVYDVDCVYKYYDGPVYSYQNDDPEQPIIVDRSLTDVKVMLCEVDLDTHFMDHPDAEVRYINGAENMPRYKERMEERRERAKTILLGNYA